ncbi:MAG: tetratricopeptide repeat protein [Armatimonadia bacterium]|nr:tetratricopeptide repeat protein [Armatimonadia bacterium]
MYWPAWHFRAAALLRLQSYEEAYTAANNAIRTGSYSGEAYYMRAAALLGSGKPEEALEEYDRAIAHGHNNRQVQMERALALEMLGRTEEAEALTEEATTAAGAAGTEQGYIEQAMLFGRARQWEKAARAYEKAAELCPDEWRRELHLATVDYFRGDLQSAIERMGRVIELRPDSPAFPGTRAHFRHQAGDTEGAMSDIEQALALDPEDAYAFYIRAQVRILSSDEPAAGLEDVRRAEQSGRARAEVVPLRAIALAQLDRWDEASEAAEEAARIAPRSDYTKYAQALLARHDGDTDEARRLAQDIIDGAIDPIIIKRAEELLAGMG